VVGRFVPLALALSLAAGLSGCKKSDASNDSAPASSSAAASSVPSAAPSAPAASWLTQDSITLIAAGSWEVVEVPSEKGDGTKKQTLLLWTVRNNTDKKLVSLSLVIFYYDQKKNQIGRKTFDKTVNIEAHRSKELPIGIPHPREPKGVEYREAVFTKATFGDGTVFDDPSQAPEKRPYEEPKVPQPPP
jgi:hypothetical protein